MEQELSRTGKLQRSLKRQSGIFARYEKTEFEDWLRHSAIITEILAKERPNVGAL